MSVHWSIHDLRLIMKSDFSYRTFQRFLESLSESVTTVLKVKKPVSLVKAVVELDEQELVVKSNIKPNATASLAMKRKKPVSLAKDYCLQDNDCINVFKLRTSGISMIL